MTEIIIISAIAKNGVIGSKNAIPWRIAEDFKHFKDLTLGYPCIMGDSTYESLPEKSRPLPGRENIVLSLNPEYKPVGSVTLFNSFDNAISYVKDKKYKKAFIIGGATIYRLGLKVADTLELTRIEKDYDGDVKFPEIDLCDWHLSNKGDSIKCMDLVNKQEVEIRYERWGSSHKVSRIIQSEEFMKKLREEIIQKQGLFKPFN